MPRPSALLAALLAAAPRRAAAVYGQLLPEGIEIALDAAGIEHEAGSESASSTKEFIVGSQGYVAENWVASTAKEQEHTARVVLQSASVERSHFILRSATHPRGFGRPSIRVGNMTVLSPQLSGSGVKGGTVGRLDRSGHHAGKDVVVTYNCLAEGTSKLLMLIPFSSTTDEEDDAIAEGDAEAAGDASVAAGATDVTVVALSWMMVCGAKPRTGLTIQLVGDVTTPHTQYADAPTVVADGAGAGAWAVDLDWSAPHPSATAQPADPTHMFVVEAEKNVTRFVASLATDPLRSHPDSQSVGRPAVSVDRPEVLNPGVAGPLRRGGTVYTPQEGAEDFGTRRPVWRAKHLV